jgi:hypothetical protein
MDDSNSTTHGEELPQHLLEALHKLIQTGASPQAICSALGLKLEEVQQVLAKAPFLNAKLAESIREKSKKCRHETSNKLITSPVMAPGNYMEQSHLEAHSTESIEQIMPSPNKKAKISEICMESSIYCTQVPQTPQRHEDTLPTFIYSYESYTDQLHRTSLVTGVQSIHRVPSYTFNFYCCWSEVPGGSLLITGGKSQVHKAVKEVVRIDTRREFAVSKHPPMLTPRREHAAVYTTPHLYVLGGWNRKNLGKCERYVCAENRWEALPALPRACRWTSGVVVESSLYTLGGYDRCLALDFVQKLSLKSLTWELMQLRLPHADSRIPYFKLRDTEVYLVVNNTLCSFTDFEVRPLKTLRGINSLFGASYYRRGTLYCSCAWGEVLSFEIGSLSNLSS